MKNRRQFIFLQYSQTSLRRPPLGTDGSSRYKEVAEIGRDRGVM